MPPAQSLPEVTSHEGAVTFSSKVNMVSVPVVVRDSKGRAVGNLKQEDFQLFDKGKLQVITRFSIEKSETGAVDVETPGGSKGQPQANSTPEKPALPERYVAYLVDDIHLQRSDLLQTHKAMNRHLDEALEPNTRAAIFTTSGRMMADFTDDRAKLHKAVDSILPWTSGLGPSTGLSGHQLLPSRLSGQQDPVLLGLFVYRHPDCGFRFQRPTAGGRSR